MGRILACACLIAILAPTLPAGAETPLPPLIDEDLILTAAASPYLVQAQVTVSAGATLSMEAGVEVRFEADLGMDILGRLLCLGTEAAPVRLVPGSGVERWGNLVFFHGQPRSELRGVRIDAAGSSPEHWRDAAVASMRTDLLLEDLVVENSHNGVRTYDAQVEIRACRFPLGNSGEAVNVQLGETIIAECEMVGGGPGFDSIDLDQVLDAQIRDCIILDSPDEGIDMGGSVALVERCFIAGCAEKGITAGEQTQLTSLGNIVIDCLYGIGVSENSTALIDHNSLHGNWCGVIVYERIAGWGGAQAQISNSIIAASVDCALEVDELSSAQVDYSLSDTQILVGQGNLLDDPRFVDPAAGDLRLSWDSPCIDSGDPDFPDDPDGTRSDMGALYRHQATAAPGSPGEGALILAAPSPNPSRGPSRLSFHLPAAGDAELTVFAVNGRKVGARRLAAATPGWRQWVWPGTDGEGRRLPAGLYLVRLEQGGRSSAAKILLLD